jgi:hypothetical protein
MSTSVNNLIGSFYEAFSGKPELLDAGPSQARLLAAARPRSCPGRMPARNRPSKPHRETTRKGL